MKGKCTSSFSLPQQIIFVCVVLREVIPAWSPQRNKAMCLSCTLQFSSAVSLLSEWEAKCLLRTLWDETSRESVRHNSEFSSIRDGAWKDPRPQRAFLGLSLLLFGIQGCWCSGGAGGASGGLPCSSKCSRKLCHFFFSMCCRIISQACEWSASSKLGQHQSLSPL